jgi:hypothetical protein
MKIFRLVREDEGCYIINQALTARRLEPRDFSTHQLEVTTSPLDRVTLFLIGAKYFKYLN